MSEEVKMSEPAIIIMSFFCFALITMSAIELTSNSIENRYKQSRDFFDTMTNLKRESIKKHKCYENGCSFLVKQENSEQKWEWIGKQ